TFTLAFDSVLTPGTIDFILADDPEGLASVPPDGFQFAAWGASLVADDEQLQVAGQVTVSLQYGTEQDNGNPVADPTLLQMVRIANGGYEILETLSNDTVNGILTATYQADSTAGYDQLGVFALVQPLPPATAGTLVPPAP
ncbi:MAG: hypothetical protein M3O15_14655, partial [Acidobacteriota bacterium]|nr:hypothetical protein [Acidobacteriota bacterium]